MKTKLAFLMILFVLIFPACTAESPTVASNSAPTEIRDPEILQEYEELTVQEENVNNCDGLNPVAIFRRSLELEQATVFEIAVEAGGLIRGTPIPEMLEVELDAKIKTAIQHQLGDTYVTSKELSLSIPSGQAFKQKIIWREKRVKGVIDVLYGDKVAKINFQRIVGFQLEDRTSRPLNCSETVFDSNQPNPTIALSEPTIEQQAEQVILTPQLDFTEADIDRLIGIDNWHCIDGSPNGISIDSLPSNFTVQYPFQRIDMRSNFYYQGEIVPDYGYATGWLIGNLPNNECSVERVQLSKEGIDDLLGANNWMCLKQFSTGVLITNVPEGFVVTNPVIYVDKYDVRYYKGQQVPASGPATVWFSGDIPFDACQ